MSRPPLKLLGISSGALTVWWFVFYVLPLPWKSTPAGLSSAFTILIGYGLSILVGFAIAYAVYQHRHAGQAVASGSSSQSSSSRSSSKKGTSLTDSDAIDALDGEDVEDYVQLAIKQTLNQATNNQSDTRSQLPDETLSQDPDATMALSNATPPKPSEPIDLSERVKTLINQGIQKAIEGNHWAAVSKFNQTLRLDPNNAIAYYNRSTAYHQLGYWDEAWQDCCQAIQLNPNHAKAYNLRGNLRQQRGDLRGAYGDYEQALQIEPTLTSARQNLETVRTKLKQQPPR